MNRFAWTNAKTIAEAAAAASTTVADAMTLSPEAMDHGDTAIMKASGIDILDLLKEGLLKPANVVSLTGVPGLDEVVEDKDGRLRIGPWPRWHRLPSTMFCNNAIQRWPTHCAIRRARKSATWRRWAAIYCNARVAGTSAQTRFIVCARVAAIASRSRGENQYHAIFDNAVCAIVHPSTAATVLVALDATVELTNASGRQASLPLEDFFVSVDRDLQRENDLRPQEILTAIDLPHLPPSVRMAHIKQGEKDSFDWPLADVAVVLDLDADGRCKRAAIVLGAAAPVPHRAKAAEAALQGNRIDEQTARVAAHAALDGATPLSKNAYKLPLFEALVRRAILLAAA